MVKNVRITMTDGKVWEVPASVIAEKRATYFAEGDEARDGTPFMETYIREYEYTLANKEEIADWLWNSTDWEDIKSDARLVEIPSALDTYDLMSADLDFEEEV